RAGTIRRRGVRHRVPGDEHRRGGDRRRAASRRGRREPDPGRRQHAGRHGLDRLGRLRARPGPGEAVRARRFRPVCGQAGRAQPRPRLTGPRMPQLTPEVARERLRSQRLVGPPFATPEAVVGWLAAVQAQDYGGAKWAVAQRTKTCSDADVEAACRDGRILRTHVLRPTWHFVLPADIRWMLTLSAPRIRAAMAFYDRRLGLTDAVCARSAAALANALRGGNHLTRGELARVLAAAGIPAAGQRLGHLMARAEIDAVICSGARRGKQATYALLDERAPAAAPRPRDDTLAELAGRYFASHG